MLAHIHWLPSLGLFVAGIIFWGGFNTAMELTNAESFCISCHEMRENVFREYQQTIHYNNRTGVRATCPDCHVPNDWPHMVVRKVGATAELYHALRGSIDTREKFIDKRLHLARKVWADMAATDSRECRNCHGFEYMDGSRQTGSAATQHENARAAGQTCIDCHKGIAHTLPEAFLEDEHERFERDGVDCASCHKGMARAETDEDWDF